MPESYATTCTNRYQELPPRIAIIFRVAAVEPCDDFIVSALIGGDVK